MIQDIEPERLDNAFREIQPGGEDPILCFEDGKAVVRPAEGRLIFPVRKELPEDTETLYAFSLAGRSWFVATGETAAPGESGDSRPQARDAAGKAKAPAGFGRYTLHELREMPLEGNRDIFAVYTGFHLWKWAGDSRFCGACGNRTVFARDERARVCTGCGQRIYPRINPAVIVGVTDGNRLLITKYKSGFRHHALIAGFTEIGETAEQTVRREVMEEVGLRVKNIRYYKSQPWGIASDLLMGFYCEADGSTEIHRDDRELGYAEWVERDRIILQPSDHSLTNEMMKRFRDGEEGPAG